VPCCDHAQSSIRAEDPINRFQHKTNIPNGAVPAPICRMILQAIARADVVSLSFARLQRTLVMDLRPGADDRPSVFVTPLLFTAAQELAAIEAHRPGLGTINRFERATWGGSTGAFAEQGLLPAMLKRMPAAEAPGVMAIFEELQEAERSIPTFGKHAKVPLEQIRAEGKT
jgi:hypothetical protein